MHRPWQTLLVVGLCAAGVVSNSRAELTYELTWSRQFGTTTDDSGRDVAVDSTGNAVVTGATGNQAFVRQYDSAGNLAWSQLISSSGNASFRSATTDSLGNSYVAGSATGDAFGPSAGGNDVIVAKYDSLGNIVWSRQYGTGTNDFASDIAVDSLGNSLVTRLSNNFQSSALTKLDTSGNITWTIPVESLAISVAADTSNNIFVAGGAGGGGYLTKYNSAGTFQWRQSINTLAYDAVTGVAVDSSGNLYVAGHTDGNDFGPNNGFSDAFVIKYDPAGSMLWSHQFGSTEPDYTNSMALDAQGNVYLTGLTAGNLAAPSTGGDIFVAKYSATGDFLWVKQIAAADDLEIGGPLIAASPAGTVYVTGATGGNLFGDYQGNIDAYLLKLSAVPEPASSALATAAAIATLFLRRKKKN